MKNILAMDTSGPSLSVALVKAGKLVYECTQQNGMTHSDSLMVLVDEAMQAGKMAVADVDCFAVVTGPGSFTGVRIGVTTAKSFAHATNKPCIGINALEAIAYGARQFSGLVCPMQDARAGQVYCAAFQEEKRVLPDDALKLDVFLEQVKPYGRCCFIGDGAVVHRDDIVAAMGDNAVFSSMSAMVLRAANVAELAMIHQDQATKWQELAPYYLRAPQAERERLAKEAAAHG